MKKSMQFFFAMCIILEGYQSFAGTPSESTVTDKLSSNAPLSSALKAPQILVITVTDDGMKPIHGAAVYAPCTGITDPIYTNSAGEAQFSWTGSCNCNGAQAEIITPDCNEYIPLKCSTNNQAICKP